MGSASEESQALALRCRIVLAAADGEPTVEIAARLGCARQTVSRWRAGSPGVVLMVCMTSRVRASRARSVMRMSSA